MGTIKNLAVWGDAHHPKWLDILRICLGVFIFWKGIQLIQNPEMLNLMMEKVHLEMVTSHYVIPIHFFGGLLIFLGLVTRIASLVQIPILLVAVIANIMNGLMGFEFWSSLICLILLIVFVVIGSGKFSLSQYLKTHKDY